MVNIAIFAVPAGLIAGGFSDAIAEDKREKEVEGYRMRLAKAFRRRQDKLTKFRVVPRFVSPVDVQAMQQIDMGDIVDAVRSCRDFRLRNLAAAMPSNENFADRLMIETLPNEGKTLYGCRIDRGSLVTIIAPTAENEIGIGNFAYYLALFGGFNYISKEYEEDGDNPHSFYLIDETAKDCAREEFLQDAKRMSEGKNRWTIIVIAAESANHECLHYITAAQKSIGINESTIIDKEKFSRLYDDLSRMMKHDFDIDSELDTRYLPIGKKNLAAKIGGGNCCNAFTLRVDWKFIATDPRTIAVARDISGAISGICGGAPQGGDSEKWKTPGIGY